VSIFTGWPNDCRGLYCILGALLFPPANFLRRAKANLVTNYRFIPPAWSSSFTGVESKYWDIVDVYVVGAKLASWPQSDIISLVPKSNNTMACRHPRVVAHK